jgi:hypothetical protein
MRVIKAKQKEIANFKDKFSQVKTEWLAVVKASDELATKQLAFAKTVKILFQEAERIDIANGTEENYALVKEKITKLIDSTSESVLSRWRTIGEFGDVLSKYVKNLPGTRDGIYEMALLVKKNKPIAKLIEQGKINSHSTINDIKGLVNKKKSTAKIDRYYSVTLLINSSEEDIADMFRGFLYEKSVIEIKLPKSVRAVYQTQFGKDAVELRKVSK